MQACAWAHAKFQSAKLEQFLQKSPSFKSLLRILQLNNEVKTTTNTIFSGTGLHQATILLNAWNAYGHHQTQTRPGPDNFMMAATIIVCGLCPHRCDQEQTAMDSPTGTQLHQQRECVTLILYCTPVVGPVWRVRIAEARRRASSLKRGGLF